MAAAQNRATRFGERRERSGETSALRGRAITFFLLALYITWEAVNSLISLEEPLTSPVGIILALP